MKPPFRDGKSFKFSISVDILFFERFLKLELIRTKFEQKVDFLVLYNSLFKTMASRNNRCEKNMSLHGYKVNNHERKPAYSAY